MKLSQLDSTQFISLLGYFLFSILVSSAHANSGESNACEGLLLRSATVHAEHLPLRQTELKVSDSKKKAEAIRALENARLQLESYGIVLSSGEGRNAKYGGVYIEIKKLPGKEPAVLSRLVYDGFTYDLIDSLRQSGTTVLLTDGSKGFSAMHAGASHPLSMAVGGISCPTITITDTTESSVVVHEVRHLDDSRSGVLKELTDWLDVEAERFKIPERDIEDLYYLIAEQRAYARQFEYLDGLAKKPDANPLTIRGVFDDQTVPVARSRTPSAKYPAAFASRYAICKRASLLRKGGWNV